VLVSTGSATCTAGAELEGVPGELMVSAADARELYPAGRERARNCEYVGVSVCVCFVLVFWCADILFVC
jgi:hypothetical protein